MQVRLIDSSGFDIEAGGKQFVIQLFGISTVGESCSILVTGFKPFFFVCVPMAWGSAIDKLTLFSNWFKNQMKNKIGIEFVFVTQKKLYGFDGNVTHNFIQIKFSSISQFYDGKKIFYTGSRDNSILVKKQVGALDSDQKNFFMEIYESNVPPLLRFFHIQDISPSGWIQIDFNTEIVVDAADADTEKEVDQNKSPKLSRCRRNFSFSYERIRRVLSETSAPFHILSFDIECSSSHGDFPLPKKTYKKLSNSILELIISLEAQTKSSIHDLFRTTLLTAFGFSSLLQHSIDRVYVKKKYAIEELETNIKTMLDFNLTTLCTEKNTMLLLQEQFLEIGYGNIHSKKKSATISFAGAAIGTTKLPADPDADIDDDDDDDDDDDYNKVPCSVEKNQDGGVGCANEVDVSFFESSAFTQKKKIASDLVSLSDLLLSSKLILLDKMTILTALFEKHLPGIRGDEVTFIGSCFLRNGQDIDTTYSHCISVGPCDSVPGVDIVCVHTERKLLETWIALLLSKDPDIIVGYNIFGFDYEFLFRRAEENNLSKEFLQLSRRFEEFVQKRNILGKYVGDLENTKVMLASGEFDLRFPKMTGRLQIDLYTYMRRDYILGSYKLDDVASAFIGDEVNRVEHDAENNLTSFITKNTIGLNLGDFIRIEEGGFSTDYYEKGLKMCVLSIRPHEKEKHVIVSGIHQPDEAKRLRWGLAKDDLSPKDLFRMTNEGPSSKAIIAKYCVQDCRLVLNLMRKIDVLTGYVEMACICSVPMSFLVLRGQGIKLTSYMAKKCRENNILMPDIVKSKGSEAYEGAIVLPPKCKMYLDEPIACVDFASLYPSSMISRNLSHDSKVWTETFDLSGNRLSPRIGHFTSEEELNSMNLKYEILTFDTYHYEKRGASSTKVKSGSMSCCFIQPGVDGKKGILPMILEELLTARQQAKKQAKVETDPFMKNILDKRQLGYKLTANSLYGQCGAKTSTFYDKDIAAATTKTGREMLITARDFIEREYKKSSPIATTNHGPVYTNAKYVYGDSVTSYCPLLLRVDDVEQDQIVLITAEDATIRFGRKNHDGTVAWQSYLNTKEICTPEKRFRIHSWTEDGWTSVKFFIRHRLHSSKKILRITTTRGIIDVTDDHSLLRPSGECVRAAVPGDEKTQDRVSKNEFLMAVSLVVHDSHAIDIHQVLDEVPKLFPSETEKLAKIDGFCLICGHLNPGRNGDNSIFSVLHRSRETLVIYQSQMLQSPVWKKMKMVLSQNVVLQKYRLIGCLPTCYAVPSLVLRTPNKSVTFLAVIPEKYFLRSCSRQTRISFLKGIVDGNGSTGYMHNVVLKKQLLAAQLFLFCKSLLGMPSTTIFSKKCGGWCVHVCLLDLDEPVYCTATVVEEARIISIEEIPYLSGFVYDLTTENHHFAGGLGELVVHNTDSVFFTFNLSEDDGNGVKRPILGQRALEITIDLAQQAAIACTSFLNADPIELAYEKTMMPFILLAKKRYVGMLYENSSELKDAKLKYMGLSLKRRDTSDYFKDTYGTIIKKLMARNSMQEVLTYLRERMQELIEGRISIEKLIVSKSLKGFYKTPQSIAHKVLADRISARDPGNAPKPGDRVQFVYIIHLNSKALLGERVETPSFIREKNLSIDYAYYVTNQLMRPLLQLLGPSLLTIVEIKLPYKKQILANHKKTLEKIERDCLELGGDKTECGELGPRGIELEAKQREKYSSSIIKDLIFGDILTLLNRERERLKAKKQGNQLITDYYGDRGGGGGGDSIKKPRFF